MPSGESIHSLVDWAQRLSDAASQSVAHRDNEQELRLDLNPVILEAARALYGIDSLSTTAERRGRADVQRRYDNLYGGVVVEWEWDMQPARREHGAQQALEYLADLRGRIGGGTVFTAVVCDGKQWGFLAVDPLEESIILETAPTTASDHFDWRPNSPAACHRFLELLGSNRAQPITPSGIRAAFGPGSSSTHALITLLAEGFVGRYADDRIDILYREWRRALDVVYGDLDVTSGDLVDIIRDIYRLHPGRPVGEHLFVLHTYFALIARLFAVEILAVTTGDRQRQPTAWSSIPDSELIERFQELDRGDLPGGLSIINLFESDVLGWWLTLCEGNTDLLAALRTILSKLADFAFPRAAHGPQRATDVLSDLYQSLIPRQMRRGLGEFLTPPWLAEACISRLRDLSAPLADGRVIDPTCGTGTFLIPILSERLRSLKRTRQLEDITAQEIQSVLDGVVGIDINPVAVTAARVNYVLTLGALAGNGTLSLPVWRADSLLVPDAPPRQGAVDDGLLSGRKFRELRTSLTEPFPIPPSLATADRMTTLRKLLEEALEDESAERGREEFLVALDDIYGLSGAHPATSKSNEWDNERIIAGALYDQIRELKARDRNGIWAQIIANAYAPIFVGQFAIVLGNPPWLAWGRLPEAWRRGSERLWQRYGLWKIAAESGANTAGILQVSDLAQFVYAVAIDRYASANAYVALLTPLAVLIADPGARSFRQCRLLSSSSYDGEPIDIPFAVVAVDDWSQVRPFTPVASNRPVFIVSRKGQQQTFPITAWRWRRRRNMGHLGRDWREGSQALKQEVGTYQPIDPDVAASAWAFRRSGSEAPLQGRPNRWDFGIGLHTRGANGIFFVRICRSLAAQGLVEVENTPHAGRNPNVRARRGLVESTLVYPLLRGRDVSAWSATPSGFIIVPHKPGNFADVLTGEELSARGDYSKAGAWLRRFRPLLQARHAPPNRTWRMEQNDWCRVEGPMNYLRSDHVVVVREISGNPAAAIIERHFVPELGRSECPLADHKLLFCAVPTLAEAIYLCASINSTPAQDFFASFASSTGFTPRALKTLPIPDFEPGNPDARILVEGGMRILGADPGKKTTIIESERADMDTAVIKLSRISNPQ